ncbi:serine protease inhibitor Kazal-type 14 [Oryx dammah]|uniref:serine protease inhibitor Kazal-type 14 n=1 Tax=Oryx dammah TaxID=59534 RepID=UPI001A9AC76D|nr:serine protease inhibitor Kazal-type 14 [Oryx dammah]
MVQQRVSIESRDTTVSNVIREGFLGVGISDVNGEKESPRQRAVKYPYNKVDFSWFQGKVNPCPGLYQPICGNNLITYENPCILCIESMKSRGKIRFLRDGQC